MDNALVSSAFMYAVFAARTILSLYRQRNCAIIFLPRPPHYYENIYALIY